MQSDKLKCKILAICAQYSVKAKLQHKKNSKLIPSCMAQHLKTLPVYRAQNAAARVVTQKPLHLSVNSTGSQLSVQWWIKFRYTSLAFKVIHTDTPLYLSCLLILYCPSRVLRSSSSSSSDVFQVPTLTLFSVPTHSMQLIKVFGTLFLTHSSNSSTSELELDHICSWATSNNLQLNPTKSKELIFFAQRSRLHTVQPRPCHGIEQVESITALGVTINNRFSVTEHVTKLWRHAQVCFMHFVSYVHMAWLPPRCMTFFVLQSSPNSSTVHQHGLASVLQQT